MGKALLSKGIWIFELQVTLGGFICTRVSNDTGQSCLAEQRNRKFFIVPGKETMGQAQNLVMGRAGMEFWHFTMGQPRHNKILKFCHGTGRDRILSVRKQREKKREKKLQSVKFFFCFDNYIQFLGVRGLIVSKYIVDLGKVRTNNDFLVCFFFVQRLGPSPKKFGTIEWQGVCLQG